MSRSDEGGGGEGPAKVSCIWSCSRRLAFAMVMNLKEFNYYLGYGLYRNKKTTFINCASCNKKYQPVNKPIVVKWKKSYFGDTL